MKALISSNGKDICEICQESFPVHPDMKWVDCGADVTTRHTFQNGVFSPPVVVEMPPMPSLAEQIIDNPAELAKLKAALGVA